MKKLTLLLSFSVLIIACGKKPKEAEPTVEQSKSVATPIETTETAPETQAAETQTTEAASAEPKEPTYNFGGEFDWTKIPVSTANIGSFPYISVPEGMYHWKTDSNDEPAPAEQPYSKKWDFSKLIMLDGNNVFDAEGKRAFLYVDMKDDSQDFAQLKFDKSVKNYLTGIGAVEIFNNNISFEVTDKLNEKDDMTVHKYMTGDVWNEPIRMYALNHSSGKVFFQVLSDTVHGEIGVVELEGFKQTIKAPTASEIKQQLDADGKAILHINFDTGKSSIKPDGQAVVEQINLLLSQHPELKLSIEGHTDNVGDSASNLKLSKDRANTVMYALAGKGIDISRLKAAGFGDTKPMVANDTDENKAKNRRVELVKF